MSRPRRIAIAAAILLGGGWILIPGTTASYHAADRGIGITVGYAGEVGLGDLGLWALSLAFYAWAFFGNEPVPGASSGPVALCRRLVAAAVDGFLCLWLATLPFALRPLPWVGNVVLVLSFLLFSLPVAAGRFSPGMLAAGYWIQAPEGISLFRALLRTFVGLLTLAAAVVSVPVAWFQEDKRMWHDLLFKTWPREVSTETVPAEPSRSRAGLAR